MLRLMRSGGRSVAIEFLIALSRLASEVGGGGSPSFNFDLLDIQWWQAVLGLVGVLGLSPAPWILGLATGKIQFTTVADQAHARELAARKEAWDEEKVNLVSYHNTLMQNKDQRYTDLEASNAKDLEAGEQHRQRADRMTDALSESTKIAEYTNTILTEFAKAAREATPDGN